MFQTIIGTISSFMYSKLLVILLIGAGVYFTIRTRFPQVRLFKNACGSVMEKPEDKGGNFLFSGTYGFNSIPCGNGKYCRGFIGDLYRWIWFCILDVGDCNHRKCICTDRKYIGTDL